MKHLLLIIIFSVTGLLSLAQNNQKPCTAVEGSQFDFWVGNWTLYSADTITGSNTIHKVMDGCAIQENFESKNPGYSGKSWSMYNPQSKLWQQTWIDNQGSFIYLTGTFENGVMTLKTEPRKLPNGKEMVNRMIFHNITKDGFDWEWESTTDEGATWKSGWHIHYSRKK
jgi:hypothetical protein